MGKWLHIAMLFLAATLAAGPAWAQAEADDEAAAAAEELAHQREVEVAKSGEFGLSRIGLAVGIGMVLLGAGLGIGRIGGQAVDGMSRQPEAAGAIQTGMIISAALIEGAAFFALIVLGFIIAG